MKKLYSKTYTSIFTGTFLALTFLSNAQNAKKNLANKYYGYLAYSKAAPIYEDLAKKAIKASYKGKAADWDAVRKAAETNYYTRDYKDAVKYYAALDKGRSATVADYRMYFESLRYTGDYRQAAGFLDSLAKLDPGDASVKEYRRLSNYFDFLKRDSARFKVEEMPFNKGLGDFSPAFYENGLMYASNRRKGSIIGKYGWDNLCFLNIYYSQSKDGKYTKKSKLQNKKFKTPAHDGPVFFDKENKTAFITRNRTENDHRKKGELVVLNLYIAEKGTDGKWGTPQPFPHNSKQYSTGHAALSPDQKTLYFASDMPGGFGGVDIWKSERVGGGWGKPVNLGPEINTQEDDMFPFISPEGNLYYASKGHVGLGGLDIYEARKNGDRFIPPINMGYPVNTQYDDFGLITEQNGKKGFFSSDRKDYIDRIYGVEMNRILIKLEGTVTVNNTQDKVNEAEVTVRNKTSGDSIVTKTDSLGNYAVPLFENCEYEVVARKKGYMQVSPKSLSTHGIKESKTLRLDLGLIPHAGKQRDGIFAFKITDCASKSPIKGLELVIQDIETGLEQPMKTDGEGMIYIPVSGENLPIGKEYAIINEALAMDVNGISYGPVVEKKYFILKGNEDDLKVTKEICLTRLVEGDVMVMGNIYYDLDKWFLRPASITSLDKAYEYLMRNPSSKLELSSHTDSRASYEYNMTLSERRAKACVDYLTKVKGVPANRLTWKGYGETRLVNGCADGVPCSEEEHQQNRRTEIRIIKL
jgi:outer membrane protein OmpA-like peptidoglycan-associated protein